MQFEICNCQFAISHKKQKHAFTLIEVILAMGLSVLVLAAVAMAVNLHLRLLDSGRTRIEEAQLAREILRTIAQDLHNAVPYNASNSGGSSSGSSSDSGGGSSGSSSNSSGNQSSYFSPSPSPSPLIAAIGTSLVGQRQTGNNAGSGMSKNSGTSSGGGLGASGGAGSSASTGMGAGTGTGTNKGTGTATGTGTNTATGTNTSTDNTTDSEDRTSDIADSPVQSVPGLYGNANQLQVDISRLPRVDQYISISSQADYGIINADMASDVRNVSYYVINNGTAATAPTNGANPSSGLVRREMSRAAGVYAAQQTGQPPVTAGSLTPIAPEVQEIDFLYTDGTQWIDTWDSVSYGGLPVAVEVSIVIAPLHPAGANAQPNVYRLLVSIPAAKLNTSATGSLSSSSSSSTSSSSTTSTTPTN